MAQDHSRRSPGLGRLYLVPIMMSPQVTAAIIAASIGLLTLIGTVITQIIGFRSTKANTASQIEATHDDTADTLGQQREQLDKTLKAQRDQLDRTLKAQRDQLDTTLIEQRKQLDRTLAEQRTRTLNERFATAAEQLGSDKPAVRLAGVYAMAGLADDWEESQQTCVDVLCAYLRMPYEPDPGQDAPEPERLAFRADREVRHTVIRVITAHLKGDAAVSWQGLNFDFTGVVFDGGDFSDAEFSVGTVRFDGARFSDGQVRFSRAEFSGGRVSFHGARFSGSLVRFAGVRFSGSTVDFSDAEFSRGQVMFDGATFSDGRVHFSNAEFSGSTVDFNDAQFGGSSVDFLFARFSGGTVDFGGAEFAAGTVDFIVAEFSGGRVDFSMAQFSGGTVDFTDPGDWSFPPAFPRKGTPPPGVKLPSEGRSIPGLAAVRRRRASPGRRRRPGGT